jgi:hypothetical protein
LSAVLRTRRKGGGVSEQEPSFKKQDKRIAENEAADVVRHQARVSTWAIMLVGAIGLLVVFYVIK